MEVSGKLIIGIWRCPGAGAQVLWKPEHRQPVIVVFFISAEIQK
jgi:hypothetical protein